MSEQPFPFKAFDSVCDGARHHFEQLNEFTGSRRTFSLLKSEDGFEELFGLARHWFCQDVSLAIGLKR